MKHDPTIEVTCDSRTGEWCETSIFVGLTATAGHGYDERSVDGELRGNGWSVDGDTTICPGCQDEPKPAEKELPGRGTR